MPATPAPSPLPAPYEFWMPTILIHGAGVSKQTGERAKALGAHRVLLMSDHGVANAGILGPIEESIRAAGLPYERLLDVKSDPSADSVEKYGGILRDTRCDCIVAVGGGSVLDAGKGLRLLHERGGRLRDYAGRGRVAREFTTPLIALTTTAGTGSQVSFGAVFTNTEAATKFPIVSPFMAPTLALNDPLLTVTAPPHVTAMTGADALAHAVESYVSRSANAFSRMFSAEATRMILENLATVYERGDDLPARDAMLLAATVAIIPASLVGLGLGHAGAMPLCGRYALPHGLVTGMLTVPVIEFNSEVDPAPYAALARVLGHGGSPAEAVRAMAGQIRDILTRVGLPRRFGQVGVGTEDVPRIVADTLASVQMPLNPRLATAEELDAFYRHYL